ncbi:putative RNA polymerase sigma-B factor [Tissierellia bacterium KA00581]|jgi:hypothetical protein|nr:putative RNA polymerase sigma-B factor [Tissierellia bacterium KA00581]
MKKGYTKPDSKEIKELFKEYSNNPTKKLREKLIESNLYIADILAKKYINKGIEYDDLFQVASVGLILAIDRYDISKGFEFSSFAMPTIVGEIKRYFRDKGWVIRVPRRIQENSKRVNNAKYHLTQTLGKVPTIKDISEYVGLSQEDVLEIMEASKVYTPQSLDQSFENSDSEDKDTNLIDIVGENDKEFDFVDNKDFITKTLQKLTDVEKKIIIGRYFEEKTQVALAKELNISQMTVSRLEKKALKKFKEELQN